MARPGKALALLISSLLSLLALMSPRAARADQAGPHTVPVAVLSFDSEDAEENADALTGAMRSRVRNAQGWSLVEVTQSLGMLTAALKCPTHPPPECQTKIAEHIKTDRYIWGFVVRSVAGQVAAEIHLYQKGKPDTVVRESFADNLKDAQDDKTLGKIAQGVLDRLGGVAIGTIVVHAADLNGEVIIDGTKHVPLQSGNARIEAAPGGHSVELSAPNAPPGKRNVLVSAGKDVVVDMSSMPGEADTGPRKPFPTRRVVGWVAVGAGVVLGAVSIYEITQWSSAKSDGDAEVKKLQQGQTACSVDTQGNKVNGDACAKDSDAKRDSLVAFITGGAGVVAIGIGAYLLLTEPKESSSASSGKTRFIPNAGPGFAGGSLVGTF